MSFKRVSRNLDLTMDYNAIHLLGNPVDINGEVPNIYPKTLYITELGNTTYTQPDYASPNLQNLSINFNTFENPHPYTDDFTFENENITFIRDGYYSFSWWHYIATEPGEKSSYISDLEWQPVGVPGFFRVQSMSYYRYGGGPIFSTIAGSWTSFLRAGEKIRLSYASNEDNKFTTNLYITKLK